MKALTRDGLGVSSSESDGVRVYGPRLARESTWSWGITTPNPEGPHPTILFLLPSDK